MNNFKKSVCSVSIAVAISASASAFAQEEREENVQIAPSITSVFTQNDAAGITAVLNVANIGQGMVWGGAEGNDSSIDIQGMGSFTTYVGNAASAEILVDGTDNVSTIEQINTKSFYESFSDCCANYAWAYTTSLTDSAAANNTGNNNSIIQIGGNNRAFSDIQVGSYNTVSVYQDGLNDDPSKAASQSYLRVNGDYNYLAVNQIALTDQSTNIVQFEITGDNNSAEINMFSGSAWLGRSGSSGDPTKYSYFKGNGNTLTADLNDQGYSDTFVEFTGDDNSVSLLTEGNSPGALADAHQIKLYNMKGDGNTYDVKSFGSAANHNLANLTGDDNNITITNLAGYNNRTIVSNLTGNRNTIDITIDGEGGDNQANVGKNPGDDNRTTVAMTGYKNNVSRLTAEGNNNITTATINGSENIAKFSASHHWKWSPGFSPTSGDDNDMIITQDGNRNYAAYMDAGDGRFYETTQLGNDNSSVVRGLGNDKYVTVYQEGDLNNSSIVYNRTVAKNGTIAGLNSIKVAQLGDLNNVELDVTSSARVYIDQDGSYNDVQLMVIHSDEDYAAYSTKHYLKQIGDGNMIQSEVNSAKYSYQRYNQEGNDNYIYWNGAGGMNNVSRIDQTGDMNTAYVTLASIDNWTQYTKVDIDQVGSYNEVDIDINGYGNGDTNFSGYDAGIVVEQTGDDNLVVGSNGFGFTIAGDYNSLQVKQVGNGNTAAGFIVGDDNTVRMYQYGNNNFASVNISAY